MRIALVEDDVQQAEMTSLWLVAASHTCRVFETGKIFVKNITLESFDLVITDWNLPDMAGDEVLAWIRGHVDWHIPVMFVTGRDSEVDIVHALEHGADDYMIKPIRRMELLARIAALGRRVGGGTERDVIDIGDLKLDIVHRSVTRLGVNIELTGREFDLALFLMKNTDRMLSRGHLLESVWGRTADVNTRTVDTHVSRIRKKLDLHPERGWRLSAVYQHGYRLERLVMETLESGEPNPQLP